MSREVQPFFNRGPSPLARLTFFCLLAVAIMVADHRFRALEAVRLALSTVLHPVQVLAAAPVNALSALGDYFRNQTALVEENKALKTKLLDYAAAKQHHATLEREHAHLLAQQKLASRFDENAVLVEALQTTRNPFTRKLYINKGLNDGLRAGQAVIDAVGVVGQITQAGVFSSEITLITDKELSVPVMLQRTGMRAIAVGGGRGGLIDVPFLPPNADVREGDVLVTSGLDGTYPPGLPVAQINGIDRNTAFAFAKINAQPLAGPENFRYLTVLTKAFAPTSIDVKTDGAAPGKTKGGRKAAAKEGAR